MHWRSGTTDGPMHQQQRRDAARYGDWNLSGFIRNVIETDAHPRGLRRRTCGGRCRQTGWGGGGCGQRQLPGLPLRRHGAHRFQENFCSACPPSGASTATLAVRGSIPSLMIRMLIVGYCYGIRHERRLCEEVKLHLAYRWFCKLDLDDKVPHHSTFSENRLNRFPRHLVSYLRAGCCGLHGAWLGQGRRLCG